MGCTFGGVHFLNQLLHHTARFNSIYFNLFIKASVAEEQRSIFVHNINNFFATHYLTRCPVKIITLVLKLKNVGCARLCTVFSGRAHLCVVFSRSCDRLHPHTTCDRGPKLSNELAATEHPPLK